jgi:hypothetical protein
MRETNTRLASEKAEERIAAGDEPTTKMAVDLPLGGYTIPWTTAETYEEAAGEGDQIATENGQIDVSGDRSYTVMRDKEPEKLVFVVSVAAGDLNFSLPTDGKSGVHFNGALYDWLIDWGDKQTLHATGSSTSLYNTNDGIASDGIPHTYSAAGKYVITIWPYNGKSDYAWARAFGFSTVNDRSSLPANKAKVSSIIEMPTKGFLKSAIETGDRYLYATWSGCINLTKAVVPDTSNLEITSIGSSFLKETWRGCTGLPIAAVPDTSTWNITSVGGEFLRGYCHGCTSLTTAVVPNTSGWRVSTIGGAFLESTWNGCTSLTAATVPDTSTWDITSSSTIGGSFLYCTWNGCTSLKDLSDVRLCTGFKTVNNFVSNTNNWYSTFALPRADATTTGAQPSLYDGTPITTLDTPPGDKNTFTNRTGMDGYNELDPNWK